VTEGKYENSESSLFCGQDPNWVPPVYKSVSLRFALLDTGPRISVSLYAYAAVQKIELHVWYVNNFISMVTVKEARNVLFSLTFRVKQFLYMCCMISLT
jgi:hypothetical protein